MTELLEQLFFFCFLKHEPQGLICSFADKMFTVYILEGILHNSVSDTADT